MPSPKKRTQQKAQKNQVVLQAREMNDACIAELQEMTSKFIDVNKLLQDRLKKREAGA